MKTTTNTVLFSSAVTAILLMGLLLLNQHMEEETYQQRLRRMVNQINSMKTSWKAQVPPNAENLTFKKLDGNPRKRRTTHPDVRQKKLLDSTETPKNFDSREEWPDCPSISFIRDQSKCGSCWSFGAAEAISDRICIHTGGKQKPIISTTDLISCCFECGDGCDGGFDLSAYLFWKNRGIVTGGLYKGKGCLPYPFPPCSDPKAKKLYPSCSNKAGFVTPKCVKKCQDGYEGSYLEDKHFGEDIYTVSGERHIEIEISKNGPVEVFFDVYEDFHLYKEGIYQHVTGGLAGSHSVKIIGYGVDGKTGLKYWTVANSWNKSWGEQGFFRILKGVNEAGIENNAVSGFPRINGTLESRN